jgi:hypothetical protein
VACADDGDPCVADTCNPATGACGVPAPNGAPCDDLELCTAPDTCQGGFCVGAPISACTTPGANLICVLSGAQGSIVQCAVQIVRATQSSTPATAFQIEFNYPPSLRIVQFSNGETCFAPGICVPHTLPVPFQKLQSGHNFTTAPGELSQWNGSGQALLVHLEDTTIPLTSAYLEAGQVVGDPVAFFVEFELVQPVSAAAPALVTAPFVVAADPAAANLSVTVSNLLIRVD